MSKTEERSKEIMQAALDYANNLDDIKPTDEFSRNLCMALGQAFIKGAEWADNHQAEKDLELSWEGISIIRQIMFNYNRTIRNEMTIPNDEDYCQEILKHFKERKGNTDGE